MSYNLSEISDSINTKIASEVAGINSRVDNIIAHNNDTEGNSELIDIRTGTDGERYSTAGEAVRNQFSNTEFNLAINYDSTKKYTIGSIVMQGGSIYQCKVNMDSAAGTFDSTKWYGPMHLSSLIQRATNYLPDAIFQIISASNYGTLGISNVFDIPTNITVKIHSDITSAMISGLPVYGAYGTFTSFSFSAIDNLSLLIFCSGGSRNERVWYALVRATDKANNFINWIQCVSESSYNDIVAVKNPYTNVPIIDAHYVHWNKGVFINESGDITGDKNNSTATDYISATHGSVIKYTGITIDDGFSERTRACAVAYYDANENFILRNSLISTITVNNNSIINCGISIVPKDAVYMRIVYSYLSSSGLNYNDESVYRNALNGIKLQITPPVLNPHRPSQIFNINLSSPNEYNELMNYSSNLIDSYGYTNAAGWENRVTINKTIVCDDVTYSAVIKLDNTSSVCALGTETSGYNSGEKPHATIVKFDFENNKMQFMAGDYDGKSIPNDIYTGNGAMTDDGVTMTNISGSSYRLEIGRRSRCPYAKVYNMTTGQLCAEYICEEYLTQSYGSKCGVLYDYPTFGTISGSVTFRRVSATVPTDVFAMFIGDSITQGARVARAEAWANKAAEFLGGHCLNCGRGGGVLNHVLDCIRDIVPAAKPKYVIVTIGTNQRNATREEYEQIRDAIIKTSAIPIINCISMLPNSVSAINNIILSLGVDSCRFDRATAEKNNIVKGQNTELFKFGTEYNDTHPNADGHDAMYNCFVATVGYIKI